MRSGALNAFARSLGDFQITVVGEVPPDTVKMIGKSIVYQPNQG
jgi:sigma-E factor negative regulatory protein RseB